ADVGPAARYKTGVKAFLGPRLRRLREDRGLTQSSVANQLQVSASYYSQLEGNQRPLTAALIARIASAFSVEAQFFSEEDEARLLVDVREALESCAPDELPSPSELRGLVSDTPQIARALVALHRRHRTAVERADALASRIGERGAPSGAPLMPYEEVRDLFYKRHNYVDELDTLAEQIAGEAGLVPGEMTKRITRRLRERGITLAVAEPGRNTPLRRFDAATRTLWLAPHLQPGQRAFQLATQVGLLEARTVIDSLASELSTDEARRLARIGLAHHFAGALLMPYRMFLARAEALHYDIDELRREFSVSYETACHRLSTLQRPDAPGVPFFFIRVDRAGNVSKRQSATDFHFSRVGGTCPLWNVYEAFSQPARILRQVAQMPDGRCYLWIARAVSHSQGGFGVPSKTHAIGLGCDLRHASRLIYARGLNLTDPAAATPIGMGCKVCERHSCPQRAFPAIGRTLDADESVSRYEPYSAR
ncbi:MAG TPA: short-chain fatty acyl-CoA regulator family protein, partial [Polyangiales bacterium]|nr:short-chain fatty acyl-CoA regulator family protein [Polyangiales bacterium]